MAHALVLIIDFGSQTTQLIARRIREAGVYCEIHPFSTPFDKLRALKPQAVVLSGALTQAGDLLVAPIENMLENRALWTAVDETRVVVSDLGAEAVALGAATMVLDTVIDNPSILPTRFSPRA